LLTLPRRRRTAFRGWAGSLKLIPLQAGNYLLVVARRRRDPRGGENKRSALLKIPRLVQRTRKQRRPLTLGGRTIATDLSRRGPSLPRVQRLTADEWIIKRQSVEGSTRYGRTLKNKNRIYLRAGGGAVGDLVNAKGLFGPLTDWEPTLELGISGGEDPARTKLRSECRGEISAAPIEGRRISPRKE